jgi:hypothetical protein
MPLTEAYPKPRTEAEAVKAAAGRDLLAAYFAWRRYAAKVEAETGLRPELFMTLEQKVYTSEGNDR